jgi:hypothetical protein
MQEMPAAQGFPDGRAQQCRDHRNDQLLPDTIDASALIVHSRVLTLHFFREQQLGQRGIDERVVFAANIFLFVVDVCTVAQRVCSVCTMGGTPRKDP